MEEDRLFTKPIKQQFEFNEEVASVFDDMISRSVPFYREVQELTRELILHNVQEGALLYDLGCSTGSALIDIALHAPFPLHLVGIDSSEAMIERARKKAKGYGVDLEFHLADILDYPYREADLFLAHYTLQFIRPRKRDRFVEEIFRHLKPGGIFIFSEKVISEDRRLDRQLIEIYHQYKRDQGYSDFEIAQKREALENVLVPYTVGENEEMVRSAGFSHVEIIFRWANFATFFARK
ncbi:MAG: carboxy-S-adenosyl-L-methionine synthase CmoA [Epsilonproteobacteria bacterium]|nr:carboxy-S-adenosyl-L-methionine synthase CmoA [Campylobacterota bacterium]NPA57301.1 carboxy-S-adenosyl-L-methionine synthase CmoA [Campylobacterota bacterium]